MRKEILGGRYASSRFPSIARLMERFSIARATAVKVQEQLKRERLISCSPGSGTYVTRRAAFRKVGIILPGLAYSEFFQPIMRTLIRAARDRGYELLFDNVFSKDPKERVDEAKELAANLIRKRVSGVIYQPLEYRADGGATNRRILSVLDRAKIPVVLLDSDVVPPPERSGYDVVSINNVEAGERLGAHLLERGAKNLCFLMRPNWVPNVMSRYRGVCLAKAQAGIAARKGGDLLLAEPDDLSAVRGCMRRRPRPDAFVCENDTTAAILRRTLSSLGFDVPGDVMLAGFDDLQIARLTTPRLTTVHQPCEELALAALERLIFRMDNAKAMPQDIYLPAPLVVRESSMV